MKPSFVLFPVVGLALLSGNPGVAQKAKPGKIVAASLRVVPAKIALTGPYAEARLLLETIVQGKPADASDRAILVSADPKIAEIDDTGTIRPRRDGKTTLTVTLGTQTAQVPVFITGIAQAAPPRFIADVVPILTRYGCNMGACHGSASGKGGLKLSLQGYDPDYDYEVITRAGGGRRISATQPENSLLLRKPTLATPHKGGKRFDLKSAEYKLLRDWITLGMPGPEPKEPTVTRLEVVPALRTLAVGQPQRFLVYAHYSDGTKRDATRQTMFSSSDESVVTVSPAGNAKVTGPGDGAILVRYQSLVATAHVVSPFQPPTKTASVPKTTSPIDRLVSSKLASLGLEASPRCSDSDLLRRAALDITGTLPKPELVRAFLADKDPMRREKLVETLLGQPDYVDFWTLKWGDILRSSRTKLNDKGMIAFYGFIRQSVSENKPWDKFARELLLARGSAFERGEANYYRIAGSPQELAESTSQIFLGVRLQCAKCHNHPYEKWTQNQYYQMAAFFARVKSKGGERPDERVVLIGSDGEVNHPRTGQTMQPIALDAKPVPATFTGDRREALAEWMTGPKNPFFASILVNRVWRHFMGRGLVEPVDDMRVTNPPTNPELLDYLAQDFIKNGYDVKHLIRAITKTDVYQRSALPTKGNFRDTKYYSRFAFKRLGAETMLDALGEATGVPEKFAGYPAGLRAAQLPDTTVPSYFLDLFGRPARNVSCECERVDDPNLSQILHLVNNADLNKRIGAKEGRLAHLLDAKTPDSRIVEELYLATLARYPNPAEAKKATFALTSAKEKPKAAEDLFWALLNSTEFLFNH